MSNYVTFPHPVKGRLWQTQRQHALAAAALLSHAPGIFGIHSTADAAAYAGTSEATVKKAMLILNDAVLLNAVLSGNLSLSGAALQVKARRSTVRIIAAV